MCYSCHPLGNKTCVDPIGSSLKAIKCTPELFSQDGTMENEIETYLVERNIRINFTKGMECGRLETKGTKALTYCYPRDSTAISCVLILYKYLMCVDNM